MNTLGETREKIFNIAVLGNTGVGKSSLLNMLAGNQNAFVVGDTASSVTQLASSKVFYFMGKEHMPKLRLIDTQGLSDTGGNNKDMEHIENMVSCIRDLEFIDLFVTCFDGANPRFTAFSQSTVSLFNSIFPNFLAQVIELMNYINLKETRCDVRNIVAKDIEEIALKKQIVQANVEFDQKKKLFQKSVEDAQEAMRLEIEKLKVRIERQHRNQLLIIEEENRRRLDSLRNTIKELDQDDSDDDGEKCIIL